MALTASSTMQKLDDLAEEISFCRDRLTRGMGEAGAARTALLGIPTKYSELLAKINAAGYGSNAHTSAQKAALDALTAEFGALRADADKLAAWFAANIVEF